MRNPRLGQVRQLLVSGAARRQQQRFVVEGPRLLAEALAASLVVGEVFAEEDRLWPGATLLRPGTLDRLGDAVTSQGLLAVVEAPPLLLRGSDRLPTGPPQGWGLDQRWRARQDPLVFVLADVADPGNAGTILRSAEAAGADAVVFAGRSVDPLSPKVVRSAAGALFRVPIACSEDVGEVLDWAQEQGLHSWATVAEGGTDLYEASLDGGLAVVLGNEAHGLDAAVMHRLAPRHLAIPMAGQVESLNVAMAATVIGFEVWRRRRAHTVPAR